MTITFEFNPTNQGKDKPQLHQILPSDSLLNETAINALLSDLQKRLMIPKEAFADIYMIVINNYAEFIQSLPNLKHNNFNCNKGQLLLSLIRASITLETADNYLCPIPASTSNFSTKLNPVKMMRPIQQEKRMAIWQFAVFSSSLLLDLAPSITSFEINTCLENYENAAKWLMLNGSMLKTTDNTHFIYEATEAYNNSAIQKLTLFFARLIIPDFIFNWLYSEKDIFFEWLGVLSDESTGSGTLSKLHVTSLRKLLNEYMGINLPKDILQLIPHHIEKPEEYHKDSFWKGVEYALRGKHKDQTKENNAGNEFLEWLKEGIADKSIPVNTKDANIHVSKEGVFLLNPEIFNEFCARSVKHPNWLTVFKQFNQLGITRFLNGNNIFQANFPNLPNPGPRRGIIIMDPTNIFGASSIPSISPAISTDPAKVVSMSKLFPTSREEAISHYKNVFNPNPNNT